MYFREAAQSDLQSPQLVYSERERESEHAHGRICGESRREVAHGEGDRVRPREGDEGAVDVREAAAKRVLAQLELGVGAQLVALEPQEHPLRQEHTAHVPPWRGQGGREGGGG